MKFILPFPESMRDWQGRFGCSREDILRLFMAGDWYQSIAQNSTIVVRERLAFGMKQDDSYSLFFNEDVSPEEPIRFGMTFDYRGDLSAMRLFDVSFAACKYGENAGKDFLRAAMRLALDLDIEKIHLKPGIDGSWYWTNRGALILAWPEKDGAALIERRATQLLHNGPEMAPIWRDEDFDELKRVVAEKDCFGLNCLIARDDLPVEHNGKLMPCRRFLVQDVIFEEAVFDLNHPWTQDRSLKKLDFNIVTDRAKRDHYQPPLPVMRRPAGALTSLNVKG